VRVLPSSREVLKLCHHWYPAYVRRHEHSPEDAQDLTKAACLAGERFRGVAPDRGMFRSFLLAALHHFMVTSTGRDAAKRGAVSARFRLMKPGKSAAIEPQDESMRSFTSEWAMTPLDHARSRLREEYVGGAGESRPPKRSTGRGKRTVPAGRDGVGRVGKR
jgi:DNA-directed RNA polymerase specialized sigma24 family protein